MGFLMNHHLFSAGKRLAPAVWLVVGWCLLSTALVGESARPAKTSLADAIFSDPAVRHYELTMVESNLTTLRQNDRAYARATLSEGTNVWPDVAIHLKGHGSFKPLNEKPSFVVKLNHYLMGQSYHGLEKLVLKNTVQDPTYVAEQLCNRLFREEGLPAARIVFARVRFNGRDLGFYTVFEPVDKDFLKRQFGNNKGNLYEAYIQDIDQPLDLDNGRDDSRADLKQLIEVCRMPDLAARWKALNQWVEVDKFATHLVLEMICCHADGYAMNRNNYRLYRDTETGRFNFITLDLDWAFQHNGMPVVPPENSIVVKGLLQTPEGKRLYRERLWDLWTRVFVVEDLTNRVNASIARWKTAASNDQERAMFDNCGKEMRGRIATRHQNFADQMVREPQPLNFRTNSRVNLAFWSVKKDSGNPVMELVRTNGSPYLLISGTNGPINASWRKKLWLDPGQYRVTASADLSLVKPAGNDPLTGLSLREGDKPAARWWCTNQAAVLLEQGIEVKEARPVDIIVEWRNAAGRIRLPLDRLAIQKLP
jgi:hypothetical protein